MDAGAVEDGRAGHPAEVGGELGDNHRRENGTVAAGGGRSHAPGFGANKNDTLLVVATLITALTYQTLHDHLTATAIAVTRPA
uniref:Uncharacterized protein n=1 Tax=Oryza glaberrima TaxID=4538 RepID=I1NLZ6_ORYGL